MAKNVYNQELLDTLESIYIIYKNLGEMFLIIFIFNI